MTKSKSVKGSVKKKAKSARALASKAAPKVKARPVPGTRMGGRSGDKAGGRGASTKTVQGKKTVAAAAPAKARTKLKAVPAPDTAGKARPQSTPKKTQQKTTPATSPAKQQTQVTHPTKGAKPAGASLPKEEKGQLPNEFDGFKVNAHVVYPTHGVGKIIAVESQEIAGTRLELFVISFEQEKMILRVPFGKAKAVGMRILSSRDTVRNALKTLRGRARVKRTMWSRRAQEYEAKINSGNLMLIAEVVRDLYRAEGQPEQSYSERQIYEAALERLAREVGAVEELDSGAALERVEGALKKAA
jgi:CarD family transcriptional regulator